MDTAGLVFFSVLDQSVDVMLGAVLRRRDLEHEGDAEERLLGVAVCHSLQRMSIGECRYWVTHLVGSKVELTMEW